MIGTNQRRELARIKNIARETVPKLEKVMCTINHMLNTKHQSNNQRIQMPPANHRIVVPNQIIIQSNKRKAQIKSKREKYDEKPHLHNPKMTNKKVQQ